MAMDIGIRGVIASTDPLDSSVDPLLRLAALYHGRRFGDARALVDTAHAVLYSPPRDREDLIFGLHAATMLAQEGEFEGIEWILRYLLRSGSPEESNLAATALENCSAFPLTVVMAEAVDLRVTGSHEILLGPLSRRRDEELLDWWGMPEDRRTKEFATLMAELDPILHHPCRPGRALAVGTTLAHPRSDDHYRYSGFLAVERLNDAPVLVPFEEPDVINIEGGDVDHSVYQMLGRPGHRAVVAYETQESGEALGIYVLPLPPRSDDSMQRLLTQLALQRRKPSVALVTDKWTYNGRESYRMITAAGEAIVGHYRPDRQVFGSCFLVHDLDSGPQETRYRVDQEAVHAVTREFAAVMRDDLLSGREREVAGSSLILAASVVSSFHRALAVADGRMLHLARDVPDAPIFVVETVAGGKYFSFTLPGEPWLPEDRSAVLQAFVDRTPDAFGVVLQTYEARRHPQSGAGGANGAPAPQEKALYARIVCAADGTTARPEVAAPVAPGTLAVWETNKNSRFAKLVLDQRIVGGCPECFGSGYRLCPLCGASGFTECLDCGGSRFVDCDECGGTGEEKCERCGGLGYQDVDCPDCNGTGNIQVPCKWCQNGVRTIKCKCENGYWPDTGRYHAACYGKGWFTKPCDCSGGIRTLEHRRCGGTGTWRRPCRPCNQTGKWNCHVCHGRRTVLCECRTGRVPCSCGRDRVAACSCGGHLRGQLVPTVS